jgi:DNA-binding transcriptional LysR family regulator
MRKIDHLDLDGRDLRLFLAVLEEGSVTAAATRLGVTQSAVSHALQKLRDIVADPLFVKSGRGIVATAHARSLAQQARDLLDGMKAFAQGASFNPVKARLAFTIAANDFQRDLLLPVLLAKMSAQTQRTDLRLIPSGFPSGDMLREGTCDLIITPRPPSGIDIFQRKLFHDDYVCFYDPAVRAAPRKPEQYFSARHITVIYPDNERLEFDRRLTARKITRDIAISVPNFYGVPAFLRGSDMLASMPSLLRRSMMQEFASVPIPLGREHAEELTGLPMYMAWHQRFQGDPAHVWLRRLLEETAAEAIGGKLRKKTKT